MSIASELTNLEGNIEDSYDAVNDMGGIIPAQRNMDNLDQAIRTIPQNTGTTYTAGYGINIDQNDEISVDTTVIAEKTDIPTNTSDLTNDGSDGNSTYVEADDLATVATSGSYNDLSNKPTIPAAQVNSDWNASSGVAQILNKPNLATVATSGSYNDLTDKPTIPETMTVYVGASFSTPSSIISVYSDSALSELADPEDMADVISAGGTVVAVYDGGQIQEHIELSSVNSNSRFPEVGHTFTSTISTSAVFSAPTVVTLLYDDYNGNWSVETTAVTAVNDATLTIQHNGTDVQTFTANQSTNATANIETIWADDIAPATQVPPITSELIDWPTMEHWSITLPGNTTVSQTTSYNYVDVPGGSITATMTVGGVYLVLLNASVRCADGATDCYARVTANGSQAAISVANTSAANMFTCVSSSQVFTATQASNTFQLQIGGGRANSSYMIAGGQISSVQIIRIA